MKTVTKTIEINVYTPLEALKEYMWLHDGFDAFKDKMLVGDKFDLEYLNSPFMLGYGVRLSTLDDYLKGNCYYFVDSDYTVFEQDNKLYVLSYID